MLSEGAGGAWAEQRVADDAGEVALRVSRVLLSRVPAGAPAESQGLRAGVARVWALEPAAAAVPVAREVGSAGVPAQRVLATGAVALTGVQRLAGQCQRHAQPVVLAG